jgi:hypothetical protein
VLTSTMDGPIKCSSSLEQSTEAGVGPITGGGGSTGKRGSAETSAALRRAPRLQVRPRQSRHSPPSRRTLERVAPLPYGRIWAEGDCETEGNETEEKQREGISLWEEEKFHSFHKP